MLIYRSLVPRPSPLHAIPIYHVSLLIFALLTPTLVIVMKYLPLVIVLAPRMIPDFITVMFDHRLQL